MFGCESSVRVESTRAGHQVLPLSSDIYRYPSHERGSCRCRIPQVIRMRGSSGAAYVLPMPQKCPPESGVLTLIGASITITCAVVTDDVHAKIVIKAAELQHAAHNCRPA